MMNFGYTLAVIAAIIVYTNALRVGRFENLTGGFWDAWEKENAENVKQEGQFGAQYGNDKLWLVSRRLFRSANQNPWDPASRGGIVSTFRPSTKSWTHKPYDRIAQDQYGDKLFSLNGRLLMLTYSTNQNKIQFHKLFFYKDENNRWLEVPFQIDPTATTLSTNTETLLTVSVPNQMGTVAYLVVSAHAYASPGSEMVYSKLDMEFRGTVPVKASLKTLIREQNEEPSAVFFTALKNDVLYGFVQNMYSEGYVSETRSVYAFNLVSKKLKKVELTGAYPPMMYDEERMFQTKDELFIVGGVQVFGLGELRNVNDIWSLNLNTLEWRGTNSTVPGNSSYTLLPAFDQKNSKLYLAGMKEGIRVAPIHV